MDEIGCRHDSRDCADLLGGYRVRGARLPITTVDCLPVDEWVVWAMNVTPLPSVLENASKLWTCERTDDPQVGPKM